MFCLAWLTLMSYLRMGHPRIFAQPLSHADASRNVEALMALPHCRVIGEQDGFGNTYRDITGDVPTRTHIVKDINLGGLTPMGW